MSEPRVFLDSDLRRISSYEVARSFPLPCSVALSTSPLAFTFDSVSSFYGISSHPFSSLVSGFLLDLSISDALRSATYDHRLAHAAGTSERGPRIVDLRPQPEDRVSGTCPHGGPVRRGSDGTARPSPGGAQVVAGRATTGGEPEGADAPGEPSAYQTAAEGRAFQTAVEDRVLSGGGLGR